VGGGVIPVKRQQDMLGHLLLFYVRFLPTSPDVATNDDLFDRLETVRFFRLFHW
jgi:hypothetical protein